MSGKVPFRSLTYRFASVYTFINRLLYDWNKKFNLIAELALEDFDGRPVKILDLACGNGFLLKYLKPAVEYEGWDLNIDFLNKMQNKWDKGLFDLASFKVKKVDVMDFNLYPEDVDVIILSDILHHVIPRHEELINHAKSHARRIVFAEPSAIHPKDMHARDWTARSVLRAAKHFPAPLIKFMDMLFADNDGINTYQDRTGWNHCLDSLKRFFFKLGARKTYVLQDECFAVWDA